MQKRIFTDPAFLFLVAINVYCIWYYQHNPNKFYTLVFLYWGQSVLIGLFNFVDILTVKNIIPSSMKMNDQPLDNSGKSKGCAAAFFAFHYGFFHFVYFIFILIDSKLKIDLRFYIPWFSGFLLKSFSTIYKAQAMGRK